MALEPSSIQRDKMLAHGKTKLTLVQFLVMKDINAAQPYLSTTNHLLQKEGGTREHQLRIDQVITVGHLPYQYLTVDSFPSSQALLLAHENSREIRQETITDIYALIVQQNKAVKKVIKSMGFLSSTFTKWFETSEIREIEQFGDNSKQLNPETDPDAKKIIRFSREKHTEPFFMMNLNRFSPSPRRGEGGRSSYNQYSARIMPRLISVGGYPDIYGKILSTYIGDQKSAFFNKWHAFVLVYYPTRTSFLRLVTNTPPGAAEIRREGLKKAVLMPCSKF